MYLVFIIVLSLGMYAGLLALFPAFFGARRAWQRHVSVRSLMVIAIFGLLVHSAMLFAPDPVGNRILHIFGGGFLALLLCYLAEKDARLRITTLQFVVLSFCIAMTLGVANEILEYFLQNYAGVSAAKDINDTWLDLISNVIGAGIACVIFAPFIPHRHRAGH